MPQKRVLTVALPNNGCTGVRTTVGRKLLALAGTHWLSSPLVGFARAGLAHPNLVLVTRADAALILQ
ncbi:MAG: hypothetical protein ACJ8EH_13370 [Sphingomicrobium sp.]